MSSSQGGDRFDSRASLTMITLSSLLKVTGDAAANPNTPDAKAMEMNISNHTIVASNYTITHVGSALL